jgi:hypothetical protein
VANFNWKQVLNSFFLYFLRSSYMQPCGWSCLRARLRKKSVLPKTLPIRILCIHHQTNEINIVDLETKLLQVTTKLNINPPYIKVPPPTPLHVKVHKHPQWNKTTYPINRNQNISSQLPNFSQNLDKKFPPQYCYYTDGSFTPPKNSPKIYGSQQELDMAYGIHSSKWI